MRRMRGVARAGAGKAGEVGGELGGGLRGLHPMAMEDAAGGDRGNEARGVAPPGGRT